MSDQAKKPDKWSSLLSDLGVDDPLAAKNAVPQESHDSTAAPSQAASPAPPAAPPSVSAPAAEPVAVDPAAKTGKFGEGIISGVSRPQAKPASADSKKPARKSFIDRLASINLFGAGSPEKIDRSAAVPGEPVASAAISEILQPKKLEKVEQQAKDKSLRPAPETTAPVATPAPSGDPWSQLASQLGVQIEKGENVVETAAVAPPAARSQPVEQPRSERQRPERQRPEQPRSEQQRPERQRSEQPRSERSSEQPPSEMPDIESLVSFREFRPKKKDITPEPVGRDSATEPHSAPSRGRETESGSSRDTRRGGRDHSSERSEPRDSDSSRSRERERGRSDDSGSARSSRERRHRQPVSEPAADSRAPERSQNRGRGRKFGREELEMTPVYDEHLELDDLDLVAPQASDDVVPSFHLGDIEEDEMPIVSSKRSRHRRSRSRRDEPRPAYAEEENLEDYSGDHAERETEREYGPPRDVFADLFPGDEPASQSREKESRPAPREKERLTRGSKTRDRNYERSFESRSEVVEERDELSWETDFEEQPKRESRSTESRRDRETIRDEEDGAYEPTVSRKPGRDRKSRGPAGRSRTVEADPFEERDEQEEQEMMQLHKSIPSWDDAVLPIVEQNIVRHGTRKPDSGGRPRGRK